MDKNQFAAYAQEHLRSILAKNGYPEGTSITCTDMDRGGRDKEMSFIVRKPGENIASRINAEKLYEECQNGTPIDMALERIVQQDLWGRSNLKNISADIQFEDVCDRIFPRVYDTEIAHDFLEQRPHTDRGDLSAVYQILGEWKDGCRQNVEITNHLLEKWGISKEELHGTAMANLRANMQPEMYDILGLVGGEFWKESPNLLEHPEAIMNPGGVPLYVLTNHSKVDGAAYIFDDETMQKATTLLGRNCMALPSSKHEILLMPENPNVTYGDLCMMVKDVNANVVPDEDFLSDKVQYYDRAQKRVLSQEEYLEREKKLSQDAEKLDKKHTSPKI